MSARVSYVYWLRGQAYREMLSQSARSVMRAHPEARVVALVDDDTELDQRGLELRRLPELGRLPAMVANLAAQVWFLEKEARPGEFVTFLDADTLLLRPIVFEASLGVTWRRDEDADAATGAVGAARFMPYNYGVLGARVGDATLPAFRWLQARVASMDARWQAWYGNQLALALLCGPAPASGSARVTRTITGLGSLDIEQRPCALFNYTPASADEDLGDRHLLHFKGRRRALMHGYAERLGLATERAPATPAEPAA